jgi:hypothetical protein
MPPWSGAATGSAMAVMSDSPTDGSTDTTAIPSNRQVETEIASLMAS